MKDKLGTFAKDGDASEFFKTLAQKKSEENKKLVEGITKFTIYIIIAIFVVILLFGSIYIVSAGERAVLLTFGKPSLDSKGEGIHFKIPLVQTRIIYDVKTQKYEADLTAASGDLQDVNTKIAINYRIDPQRVPEIYQTIGVNYADKVVYPLEQETNKAVTSQYTAVELITKREEVRGRMKSELAEKLAPRGIIIEEVSIINFAFSPSFTAAIENKVTQEQNALAAKNKLEQVKYEAEQRVTQAKGEAEAIKIQAQAITSQGGKEYVQLQFIKQWNGILPTTLLQPDQAGLNAIFNIGGTSNVNQI